MDQPNSLYMDVDQALRGAGAPVGAAESQGVLCGMACAGVAGESSWLRELMPDADEGGPEATQARSSRLGSLYAETMGALFNEELGFQLLLPGEEMPLAERVQALGQWVQGFLYGLGLKGNPKALQGEKNIVELIEDFNEIARVDVEQQASDEASEQAFFEIVEYVRVGVMLIQSTLNPPAQESGLQ